MSSFTTSYHYLTLPSGTRNCGPSAHGFGIDCKCSVEFSFMMHASHHFTLAAQLCSSLMLVAMQFPLCRHFFVFPCCCIITHELILTRSFAAPASAPWSAFSAPVSKIFLSIVIHDHAPSPLPLFPLLGGWNAMIQKCISSCSQRGELPVGCAPLPATHLS